MVQRDKDIVFHVEKYGALTIKQCGKIFFTSNVKQYQHAGAKLNTLYKNGYLKYYICPKTKQKVYYINKKLTYHGLLLMDYYAELYQHGAEVLHFRKEVKLNNNKIRSDGFCVYRINNNMYFDIVEVQTSNNNPNLERYDQYCETNEIQKELFGIFPRIILIQDKKHTKRYDNIKVICLKENLNDFNIIFN